MKSKPGLDPGPSQEMDENALLARVAAGDHAAFASLYRGYWPRLGRFLRRWTHRPQLAHELLNDTMLAVWQQAGSFRAQSRVSTWIFAIAYRKALKAMSALREAPGDGAEEIAFAEEEPEREAMRSELRERLRRALATLPAEQRAVVELTYYHGYAYGEIAQIMQCPVDTVKTRMFHARRKLRLLFEPAEGEG